MTTLKSMEARLQAQSALHFLPYIGPEYGVAAPRIVMLGEAAHGPAPAGQNRSFVRSVVRTALDESAKGMKGDHWIRYVRNIEAMLGGREYGAPEHCWQKLAYAVLFSKDQDQSRRRAHAGGHPPGPGGLFPPFWISLRPIISLSGARLC